MAIIGGIPHFQTYPFSHLEATTTCQKLLYVESVSEVLPSLKERLRWFMQRQKLVYSWSLIGYGSKWVHPKHWMVNPPNPLWVSNKSDSPGRWEVAEVLRFWSWVRLPWSSFLKGERSYQFYTSGGFRLTFVAPGGPWCGSPAPESPAKGFSTASCGNRGTCLHPQNAHFWVLLVLQCTKPSIFLGVVDNVDRIHHQTISFRPIWCICMILYVF